MDYDFTGFKEHSLPCPCGNSSDAYAINYDGTGKCFSCNKFFKKEKDLNIELKTVQQPVRGWTQETVELFGIWCKVDDRSEVHNIGYVWPNGAVKVRNNKATSKKDRFTWLKNDDNEPGRGLYAMDKFEPGSKPSITITEGEADSPSVYQTIGGRSACVGVSSSSAAYNEIRENFKYVDSFDKVILCFDNDEAGERALKQVASLFQNQSKLYYCHLDKHKDANDYLLAGDLQELADAWYHAKRFTNSSFINTFSEVTESLADSVHEVVGTYPLEGLQNALRGFIRGELVVFKGLEGLGKTEAFRLCEHHLLKENPNVKIAAIHMEEDKSTTIKGLATYEADRPMYFEEDGITPEEVLDFYKKAVGDNEDRFFIYKITGGDDPDEILSSIRLLVHQSNVDIVFLDNLNKMVDSLEESDERQKLVYIASKLKDMAMELNISIVIISHVNDDGKALGSRYTTKVADKVIHMIREIGSIDPVEKNTLYFFVEKGRMARRSGVKDYIWFNENTFKLEKYRG